MPTPAEVAEAERKMQEVRKRRFSSHECPAVEKLERMMCVF